MAHYMAGRSMLMGRCLHVLARAQGLPPAGAAALLAAAESAHQLPALDGRAHLHSGSMPMPSTFAACADYAPSTSEGFAADLTRQCVTRCMVPNSSNLMQVLGISSLWCDSSMASRLQLVRPASQLAMQFVTCVCSKQQHKLGFFDMPYHDLCRAGSSEGLLRCSGCQQERL